MNTQVQASVAAFVSKMTVKSLGCDPAAVHKLPAGTDVLPLARIFGRANGTKNKTDSFGEVITAIIGDFEGVNLANGKAYSSSVLYLPGGIHERIESTLYDKNGRPVEFGVEISVRKTERQQPDGKKVPAYTYEVKELVKAQESDSLKGLREKVNEAPLPTMPAPAAPAGAATQAPAAEAAPAKAAEAAAPAPAAKADKKK